jgi:hypothetical protein
MQPCSHPLIWLARLPLLNTTIPRFRLANASASDRSVPPATSWFGFTICVEWEESWGLKG